VSDDDKRSFWTSLPGILTGAAALLTAIGGLIYHHQSKQAANPDSATQAQVRVVSAKEGGAKPGSDGKAARLEETRPPEGFEEKASYQGDCANPPAGESCISFRDQYQMLVKDEVPKRHNDIGEWDKHSIMEAVGKHASYQHILGTKYVKILPK